MGPRPLRILSLCSGSGMLDLGLSLALTTCQCVCWVGWDAFELQHLVRKMQLRLLDDAPCWSDARTFDGLPWRGTPIGGSTVAIARPAPALPHGRKLTADERMELLRLLALRFWDVEAKETEFNGDK